jgi:hypothetical protein
MRTSMRLLINACVLWDRGADTGSLRARSRIGVQCIRGALLHRDCKAVAAEGRLEDLLSAATEGGSGAGALGPAATENGSGAGGAR